MHDRFGNGHMGPYGRRECIEPQLDAFGYSERMLAEWMHEMRIAKKKAGM